MPTLAVVFLSIKQDKKLICNILDKKGIAIYGATTDGEFTDMGLSEGAVAILLLDINPDYFSIFFDDIENQNYRKATRTIAHKAQDSFTKPAFLISVSGLSTMPNLEQLLTGFEDILGDEVNVFGGLAGDDITLTEQFVFTNNRESNQGIVAVAFDSEKISLAGKVVCGWKPMGTVKTVTKSRENKVYELDGVPPVEIIKKYGGLLEVPFDNPAEQAVVMNQTLALQLQRDHGDPVMRVVLFDKEDGSFTCMGSMPEGSKLRFCPPPDFEVMDHVIKKFEELKEEEMPEADAVIMYSCTGRLITFGPTIRKEIEGIQKVWNTPTAGFFCNGELARPSGGKLELHNLTICGVALKEK